MPTQLQRARDGDGEMSEIADEPHLDASPAAEVNRPPVGTHDEADVPDLPDVLKHDDAATSDD